MADDDPVDDALLEVQIRAIESLSGVARRVIASDPNAGSSVDLFAKWLILRAETSALLRVVLNAGVCSYEAYVNALVDEAKELADEYLRASMDSAPPAKIIRPN